MRVELVRPHGVLAGVHAAFRDGRGLGIERAGEQWAPPALLIGQHQHPENHLVELFTREIGVPPHQYLLARRLERGAELLAQTDLPITTLALDLGFASSSHFAVAFRNRHHRAPSTYRRAARGA
jgi:methylphosphotriester-DNA--protein-cysteine methyltransferase